MGMTLSGAKQAHRRVSGRPPTPTYEVICIAWRGESNICPISSVLTAAITEAAFVLG